jgi:protein-tyrosine kinase
MSRIDQALAKGLPEAVPTANDAAAENPWDLSASVAPPDAEAADVAMRMPRPAPSADAPPPDKIAAPDLGQRLGRGDAAEKIVGSQLPPDVVEEYRRLSALLHHTQIERNSQVLMITSAVAGEGKTLTATNLALTLSGSYGRNVLLVDADLRRPSLHQMFNVANVSGLSDLLSPGSSATPSLMAISPRLTLLTAGRPDPDPMAALTSTRMKQLIEEAKGGFDWVIIDTPPVGLLTDASLLAQMVDLALLVVRAESTPFEQVQRAADAIGRHRITGVVLNRVSKTALGEANRYSEYYSSYGTVEKG